MFKGVLFLALLADAFIFKVLEETALKLLNILKQAVFQFFVCLAPEVVWLVVLVTLFVKWRNNVVVEELVGINHVIHLFLRKVHVNMLPVSNLFLRVLRVRVLVIVLVETQKRTWSIKLRAIVWATFELFAILYGAMPRRFTVLHWVLLRITWIHIVLLLNDVHMLHLLYLLMQAFNVIVRFFLTIAVIFTVVWKACNLLIKFIFESLILIQ